MRLISESTHRRPGPRPFVCMAVPPFLRLSFGHPSSSTPTAHPSTLASTPSSVLVQKSISSTPVVPIDPAAANPSLPLHRLWSTWALLRLCAEAIHVTPSSLPTTTPPLPSKHPQQHQHQEDDNPPRKTPNPHRDRHVPLAQFAAGALAGLVNVIVLSPLEVVKVRLQAQSRAMSPAAAAIPQRYNGMVHALRLMLQEEGWRSYYRGINASLWAFIPNWAIYWYAYEALKRKLTPPHARSATPITHVTAAMGAGALTALATAPLWTLKSRLQTDIATGATRRYTAVWTGLRKIAADEGFFALYKGLTPTLFGLGHVMIQFPVYEHIKARLSKGQEENIRPAHILVASSVSKIVASAAFYGHEVIRVRIQLDSRIKSGVPEPIRMVRLARDILRTEGLRGLYRGFGTNLVRTVPACMVTFTSYEMAKRFVLEHQHFLNIARQKEP